MILLSIHTEYIWYLSLLSTLTGRLCDCCRISLQVHNGGLCTNAIHCNWLYFLTLLKKNSMHVPFTIALAQTAWLSVLTINKIWWGWFLSFLKLLARYAFFLCPISVACGTEHGVAQLWLFAQYPFQYVICNQDPSILPYVGEDWCFQHYVCLWL